MTIPALALFAALQSLAPVDAGPEDPVFTTYAAPLSRSRYLVDEGFLDRAAGEYWRAGGTVG